MLTTEQVRTRAALRDAIAYGVLCTDRAWNGVTMGDDQAETDRRLDAMLDEYLKQA